MNEQFNKYKADYTINISEDGIIEDSIIENSGEGIPVPTPFPVSPETIVQMPIGNLEYTFPENCMFNVTVNETSAGDMFQFRLIGDKSEYDYLNIIVATPSVSGGFPLTDWYYTKKGYKLEKLSNVATTVTWYPLLQANTGGSKIGVTPFLKAGSHKRINLTMTGSTMGYDFTEDSYCMITVTERPLQNASLFLYDKDNNVKIDFSIIEPFMSNYSKTTNFFAKKGDSMWNATGNPSPVVLDVWEVEKEAVEGGGSSSPEIILPISLIFAPLNNTVAVKQMLGGNYDTFSQLVDCLKEKKPYSLKMSHTETFGTFQSQATECSYLESSSKMVRIVFSAVLSFQTNTEYILLFSWNATDFSDLVIANLTMTPIGSSDVTPFIKTKTPLSIVCNVEKFTVTQDICVIDISSNLVNTVHLYDDMASVNVTDALTINFTNANIFPLYIKKGQVIHNFSGGSAGGYEVTLFGYEVEKTTGSGSSGTSGDVAPAKKSVHWLPDFINQVPGGVVSNFTLKMSFGDGNMTDEELAPIQAFYDYAMSGEDFDFSMGDNPKYRMISFITNSTTEKDIIKVLCLGPNFKLLKMTFETVTHGISDLFISDLDLIPITKIFSNPNQEYPEPVTTTYLNKEVTVDHDILLQVSCSSVSSNHQFSIKVNGCVMHSLSGLPTHTITATQQLYSGDRVHVQSNSSCVIKSLANREYH